jgi:hypothetical protein
LDEIDREVKKVEAVLRDTPDIAAFTRRTGTELGLFATAQTKGDILVRLKPPNGRRRADAIIEDLRGKLEEDPDRPRHLHDDSQQNARSHAANRGTPAGLYYVMRILRPVRT